MSTRLTTANSTRGRHAAAGLAGRWARTLIDAFAEHTLLTYASAISFQVATAIVPLALMALGLLGAFGLDELWRDDVRPGVVASVSPSARQVIDQTVGGVLSAKQLFWATGGALLAVWQVSGAVRVAVEVVGVVHGVHDDRSFVHRYALSLSLSVMLILLVLGAVTVVNVTPLLDGHPAPGLALGLTALRWLVAGALLAFGVGLVLRLGPDRHEPTRWVSTGTAIVVFSWVLASLGFLLYLTQIASYGSVFGALATVVVLFAYVYLSAVVFVFGIQADALLRAEVLDQRHEAHPEPGALPEGDRHRASAS